MSLPPEIIGADALWLEEPAPCNNVVVTTRVRLARNVTGHPFTRHASKSVAIEVLEALLDSLEKSDMLGTYFTFPLGNISSVEASFLKEARLISKEMEHGGHASAVVVRPDLKASVMINEEDHLRLQALEPGLQAGKAHKILDELDGEVASLVPYAYHPRLGFLTACPTNVGTGLRVSVMMHLPGLSMNSRLDDALKGLANYGLTARGFHGENSETTGDFHQISNEVTLGKTAGEIEEELGEMVSLIMEKELESRSMIMTSHDVTVRDSVWRSFGLLTHARKIDTAEAMTHLSRLRLGIDEGYFGKLSHECLNRLVVEVQPGHLLLSAESGEDAQARDVRRATLIRNTLLQGVG